MPRINKIRVANIRYDHNKKQMPDMTFNLDKNDSIFLLGNGGGKSLLVQLILQVIIPNARMGKRRISDLFESGSYSGHVVVEWVLDREDDKTHYLATGFCFAPGYGDQPIRYFNYIFDYDEESSFDISTLPLIKSADLFSKRTPTSYQEYRDWLREHSDKRIHIFERIGEYQNYLKQYRILSEEWENIKQTNSSEGGVDEFFAKSRNSIQLVENLLIPSVEEMMFKDKKRKKELFYAFSEYRNKLLEMPKIKANIKDFSLIKEDAENLVETVKELGVLIGDINSKKVDLGGFGVALEENINDLFKQIDNLKNEEEKLNLEIEELVWKKESHKLFSKKLKLKEVLKNREKIETSIKDISKKLEDIQESNIKIKAIEAYNFLKEELSERTRYQKKLEILDESNPELRKKLNIKKRELGYSWELKSEELMNKKDDIDLEKEDLKEKKDKLKTDISSKKEELEERREEQAKLNAWLDNYKSKKIKIKEILNMDYLKDPYELRSEKSKEKDERERKKDNILKDITKIEEDQEKLTSNILKTNRDKVLYENKIENLDEKLSKFRDKHDMLLGNLASEEMILNNLLDNKNDILFGVKNRLKSYRENRVIVQSEISNLEEKWALFTDRDYYIPDSELVKVKKILEDNEIYTVLGSEWLSNQEITSSEKKGYIKQQPLLPYSILIEESQIKKIENILKRNDIKGDYPLFFLVKNVENLSTLDSLDNFININKNSSYIFQPNSTDIYTSKYIFKEFKDNLIEKIEKLKNDLTKLKNKESIWNTMVEKIENFYQDYTRIKIDDWQNTLKELKNLKKDCQKRLEEYEKEKLDLKETIKNKNKKLEDIKQEIIKLYKILEKIDEFIIEHKEKTEKEKTQKNLKGIIKRLKGYLSECENDRERLYEKELDLNQRIREISQLIKKHDLEGKHYDIENIDILENEKDYDEIKLEVDEILKNLNKNRGERQDIERIIEKCSQEIEKYDQTIFKLGIKKEWLEKNQRIISGTELEETNKKLSDIKEKLKTKQNKKVEYDIKKNRLEGALENAKEYILNRFEKEPYSEYSENHELELKNIKQILINFEKELSDIKGVISETIDRRQENSQTLKILLKEYPDVKENHWKLVKKEWDFSDISTEDRYFKYTDEIKLLDKKLVNQKRKVDKSFNNYLEELKSTDNPNVRQFIRKVKSIMENQRIYDYDFVETQFLRVLEGLERYKQEYQRKLEKNKEDMEHLTNLCLRRAQVIYDAIKEIPKSSKIDLYGKRVQVIKMNWEIRNPGKERELIFQYLDKVLYDLQKLKEEGVDDDIIDSKMEERLRTRNLINVIAPLDNCRVRVFKPRKESIINEIQLDYSDWREVTRWSGGEEYSVYMTMFMIMVSYIRKQLEGRTNGYKTILADNPFGKASSPHILEIVFEVARSNNIQLVCLTAHRQESIMEKFPVVYSLKLRNAYGKEVMTAEKMEVGFYIKK